MFRSSEHPGHKATLGSENRRRADQQIRRGNGSNSHGVSLLETMVAAAVLVVGITGLMGAFTFAVTQTAGQGEDATRSAEYAQDKMEQLMSLTFNDATTDINAYDLSTTPCCTYLPANQTGLGGALGANNTVGGVTIGSAVTGYADYLDASGGSCSTASSCTTAGNTAYFVREWRIAEDSTGNIKTITVLCYVIAGPAGTSSASTLLVSMKGNY